VKEEGKCHLTYMPRELLTTAKVYYRVREIVYIRRHSTTDAELQQFQALEAEAQKWKVSEKQLAEQLANLWKDWNCRMKSDHPTESNQPQDTHH